MDRFDIAARALITIIEATPGAVIPKHHRERLVEIFAIEARSAHHHAVRYDALAPNKPEDIHEVHTAAE